MDGAPDILALERDFERLRRFLEQPGVPLGRAVAIARFAIALPSDLQGRAYYLAELREEARAALGDVRGGVADPQLRELLRRAELIFDPGSPAEEAPAAIGALPADPLGESRASGAASCPDTPCRLSQARLQVPLVQILPEAGVGSGEPSAVGILAQVTMVPRVASRRGTRFEWHNRHAAEPAGELRSLQDVSADALLAAREALAVADARARLQGRATRWLDRLLAGGSSAAADRLGFQLSLPEKSIPVAGDSIGLALAVAFAGALRGLSPAGDGFRPRAGIAWTGRVLPSGQVLEVDTRSLRAKIRAVHFAGMRALVVPAGMGVRARAIAAAEGCALSIQEIAHVSEAVGHPGLTETWRLRGDLVEGCTHRRLRLGLAGAALIGLTALLLYHLPLEPRRLTLENSRLSLRIHYQGLWPSRVLELKACAEYAALVENLDGDKPGARRLVYATSRGRVVSTPAQVVVFDPVRWRPVWADTITTSGLPHEPADTAVDGFYSSKVGLEGDFDRDGRLEILLAATFNPHADTFLWFYDGLKGRVSGCYHDGHIEHLVVDDLDCDGTLEVVADGHHGPSRGISILALRLDQLRPCGGAAGAGGAGGTRAAGAAGAPDAGWDPRRQPCLFHLVAPVIPGLEAMDGRRELGLVDGWTLSIMRPPAGPRRIQIGVNVQDRKRSLSDYILTCDEGGHLLDLIASTPLRDRAAEMLRRGETRIDFGSDSLLTAWRASFSHRAYIQNEWPAREER